MDQDFKLEIVKNLIDKGELKEFREIFEYVEKTFIHKKTGINYYKLLRLVKNPMPIKFEDVYSIASVFKVSARSITDLIHGQIESKRKKK